MFSLHTHANLSVSEFPEFRNRAVVSVKKKVGLIATYYTNSGEIGVAEQV